MRVNDKKRGEVFGESELYRAHPGGSGLFEGRPRERGEAEADGLSGVETRGDIDWDGDSDPGAAREGPAIAGDGAGEFIGLR